MDHEALVRTVTAEVLRQLERAAAKAEPEYTGKEHNVLAVFTGGSIGLEQGLAELRKIQAAGAGITVVLSCAAEQIVGVNRIKGTLGSDTEVITAQSSYPGRLLREADIVLIPVLTQNTAAKLAHTLADTLVSTIILQALMLGKPVLAAQNAADPQDGWRVKGQMTSSAPALLQALQANLKKIENYGMRLLPVGKLATETQKNLMRGVKPQSGSAAAKRIVIDAEAVKAAAAAGTGIIHIASGALITPLARDLAQEYGLKLAPE